MQYYLSEIPEVGHSVTIDGEEGHHLTRVKRCEIGESINLFDGKGSQAKTEVIQVNKKDAILKISSRQFVDKPVVKTVLLVVPPKGKNFPLILEKAVEIGVDEIIPIVSERSVKEYQIEKEEKYEKILLEASKQCERPYLPELSSLMSFAESMKKFQNSDDLKLLFHPKDGGKYWEQANRLKSGTSCCMWIGPEGGWSENEIVFARTQNTYICTLPMPVLRVETAVIAITSLIKTYLV
jgi:16S rRNA (uracil1498-N3)-methyltransferase